MQFVFAGCWQRQAHSRLGKRVALFGFKGAVFDSSFSLRL
jgi:hypothetical protein